MIVKVHNNFINIVNESISTTTSGLQTKCLTLAFNFNKLSCVLNYSISHSFHDICLWSYFLGSLMFKCYFNTLRDNKLKMSTKNGLIINIMGL